MVLFQGPKLLDLDLTNGLASERGDSELSLKVDLNHFGEVIISKKLVSASEIPNILIIIFRTSS